MIFTVESIFILCNDYEARRRKWHVEPPATAPGLDNSTRLEHEPDRMEYPLFPSDERTVRRRSDRREYEQTRNIPRLMTLS